MNFQSVIDCTYWWPVTLRVPSTEKERAGEIDLVTFNMKFKPLGRDAAIASQEAYVELGTARETADHEFEQAREACVDWDDVWDAKGNPKPFSADALHEAWQHAWFRTGVYEAMADSLSGEGARAGN